MPPFRSTMENKKPTLRCLQVFATALVYFVGVALAGSADQYPDKVGTVWWRPLREDGHTLALFPLDARARKEGTGLSVEEVLSGADEGDEDDRLAPAAKAGDVVNVAEMGRPARLTGGAELVTGGRFRGALRLEGGALETRGYDGHNSRTVGMWIKPAALPEKLSAIFSIEQDEDPAVCLAIRPDGTLQVVWKDRPLDPADLQVKAGQWIHVALAWSRTWPNAKKVLLTVNGRRVQEFEGIPVRGALGAPDLVVGRAVSVPGHFRGWVDEVRFSRSVRRYYERDTGWVDGASSQKAGPGRPYFRDKNDLLFHLPLNWSLDPARCAGNPSEPAYTPEPGAQKLRPWNPKRKFKPGVEGQALTLGRKGLNPSYDARGNLFTEAGTIAFWMRPLDWDNFTRDNRFDDIRPRHFGLFTVMGDVAEGSWEAKFRDNGPIMTFNVNMNMAESVTRPVDLHPGRWVHVAFTWRGAKVSHYVNGRPRSPDGAWGVKLEMRTGEDKLKSDPRYWREATPTDIRFDWRRYVGRAPVHTLIDDFRVYRRPLSAEEIANLPALNDSRGKLSALPDVDLEYSYNGVLGEVDGRVVPLIAEYEQAREAALEVRRKSSGEKLGSATGTVGETGFAEITVQTDPMDFATYEVQSIIRDGQGNTLGGVTDSFTREKPPWWNGQAGLSETVMPDWVPVEYEGDTVKISGVNIVFADSGLPKRIISAGEDVLAAPVELVAARHDKKLTFPPSRHSAAIESDAETSTMVSGMMAGGGLRVKSRCRVEFDGMMWLEVTLRPDGEKPVRLDSLRLRIPYRPNNAEMLHWWSGARNFRDPEIVHIGAMPEEEGVVFRSNSQNVGQPEGLRGSFIPYVMITGDERGMAWFARNDQGWTKSSETPALQIDRTAETVTLVANVISSTVNINEERTFAFGLHPIPVKPLEKRWRMTPGWGVIPDTFSGNNLKGRKGPTTFDMYPEDSWQAVWRRINGEGLTKGAAGLKRRQQQYIEQFRDTHGRDPKPRETRVPALYWDLQWTGNKPAHTREWEEAWGLGHGDFQHYDDAFVDFASWCWDEWLRHTDGFIRGIYMDDVWGAPQRLLRGPAAYQLPDGHVQPGYQFLGYRARLKRTRQISYDHDIVPHLCAHSTHTFLIPYHSFFDVILDGEDHYSSPRSQEDFLDKWPLPRLRFMNARKWGLITTWLGWHGNSLDTDKWPAWTYRQNRAYVGALALHDIEWKFKLQSDFRLRAPGTEFIPYWDEEGLARTRTDWVKVSAWKRPGRCLVLLVNVGEERVEAEVRLDPAVMGLRKTAPSQLKVVDVDGNLLRYFDDDVTRVEAPEAGRELMGQLDTEGGDLGDLGLEERPEDLPLEERRAQDPDGKYSWTDGVLTCPIRRHDFRLFEFRHRRHDRHGRRLRPPSSAPDVVRGRWARYERTTATATSHARWRGRPTDERRRTGR